MGYAPSKIRIQNDQCGDEMSYSDDFLDLVETFQNSRPEYLSISSACVAQFILESGRGGSLLAREHNNFCGMKWRPEMEGYAARTLVAAPSETAYFCSFDSIEDFVDGYWRFLDRAPYEGWEDHAADPYQFIEFVGGIWATDPAYKEKLMDLLGEADQLLGSIAGIGDNDDPSAPCCNGMSGGDPSAPAATSKPKVEWDPTPFHHSRGGTTIDTIVMHYTTSRNLGGTVSWFKNPNRDVLTAAHYVIGRGGEIVQMVADDRACIHGNSQNSRSIGIEHSAAAGDTFTPAQEKASAKLILWLMVEYGIDRARVIGHKCAPRGTACPGDLFANYGATSSSPCSVVTQAIQSWLDDKVL